MAGTVFDQIDQPGYKIFSSSCPMNLPLVSYVALCTVRKEVPGNFCPACAVLTMSLNAFRMEIINQEGAEDFGL